MRTLQQRHFDTVVAETTSGVLKLKETVTMDELPFSAINENEFLTKSKFDNVYSCVRLCADTAMGQRSHFCSM